MNRFSRTVIRAKMCRPSGAWQMPRATISWGLRSSIRAPRRRIAPPASPFTPEMVLSVVVLPAPFPPIRVTTSPSFTSIEIPLTASMPP
jgi:hypothetical protein